MRDGAGIDLYKEDKLKTLKKQGHEGLLAI